MRALAVVVSIVFVAAGCQPAIRAPDPALVKKDVEKTALAARVASDRAELKCKPLLEIETTLADERFVGETLALRTLRESPVDVEQTRSLIAVGQLLAKKSARPDLEWTFAVVKSDLPSATGFPGGLVFISTALLAKLENEAQLAGILAHEIAHVAAKDPLNHYRRARHMQCVAANTVATLAELGVEPSPAMQHLVAFARKFDGSLPLAEEDDSFVRFILDFAMMLSQLNDRAAEYAADRIALGLVSFSGYDASQYETALTTWNSTQISAHPPTAERVLTLKTMRQGDLAPFTVGTAKPALR